MLDLSSDPSKLPDYDSSHTETVKKKINDKADRYNSRYKVDPAALIKPHNTNYQI